MSKKKSKQKAAGNTIAVNRRARHEYFIEDRFEAGLCLEGWEVKSLRAGRALWPKFARPPMYSGQS